MTRSTFLSDPAIPLAAVGGWEGGRGPGSGSGVRYFLVVTPEGSDSVSHLLPVRGSVDIGRSRSCSIRIQDPLVDWVHARLHVTANSEGTELRIEDFDSPSGTFVRGTRIRPRELVPVVPGDIMTMGSTQLVVRRHPPEFDLERLRSAVIAEEIDSAAGKSVFKTPAVGELAKRAALGNINILILGETGVGKECLARSIHHVSKRKGDFVVLNHAGLSPTLMEIELFGCAQGALTGVAEPRAGAIEAANDGTVFLDEVCALPLDLQARLLRAIETREVLRIGAVRPRVMNMRFVAATNRNLEREVLQGTFRVDLLFRLNGISLTIPPLRERTDEIPTLVETLIRQACTGTGREPPPSLTPEAMAQLLAHSWPGNIRELKNVVERALLLCDGPVISPEYIPLSEP